MGNFLNWTYFDIRARYKRMTGYNVLFPQGWDCHGLPTEVAVEKAKGIRKNDVPPDVFRKMCEEWIEQYIGIMKTAVIRLGASIDWTTEYRTMEPEFIRKIQLSFLMLYEKDMIYKGEHPINWCPRCETAIADAEVEHEHKAGMIYTIPFMTDSGEVLIATTRPIYLPACVALSVHPGDERYNHLIGGEAIVPVFGQRVPIIGNDEVDPEFGTGAMMICTYGDKADVVAVHPIKAELAGFEVAVAARPGVVVGDGDLLGNFAIACGFDFLFDVPFDENVGFGPAEVAVVDVEIVIVIGLDPAGGIKAFGGRLIFLVKEIEH